MNTIKQQRMLTLKRPFLNYVKAFWVDIWLNFPIFLPNGEKKYKEYLQFSFLLNFVNKTIYENIVPNQQFSP